jgi:hypothetical protein
MASNKIRAPTESRWEGHTGEDLPCDGAPPNPLDLDGRSPKLDVIEEPSHAIHLRGGIFPQASKETGGVLVWLWRLQHFCDLRTGSEILWQLV